MQDRGESAGGGAAVWQPSSGAEPQRQQALSPELKRQPLPFAEPAVDASLDIISQVDFQPYCES